MNKILTKQLSDQIVNWWAFFMEAEYKIFEYFMHAIDFNVVEFMQDHLQCINNNLMWEFGPAVSKKGYRLVITPEFRRDLRPLVKAILENAPELSNWEFYDYRLSESFESAKLIVEAKTGYDLPEVYFLSKRNDFNLIDVTFLYLNLKDEAAIKVALHQSALMVEHLLGEKVFDTWIGAIEIGDHFPEDESHHPISQLNNWIENEISTIKNALPGNCFYERSGKNELTLYELEPDGKAAYPRQEDMFLGKTVCVPLWENIKSNYSFNSERFSKTGEIFCYIKIYQSDCVQKENIETKSPIEEAVDNVLISSKLGCTIGGGIGLQYTYIDIALVDLDKGIAAIKRVLQERNVPKNSWILFFDSELEAEWIGIWDDSPAPPMPDFERK